MTTQKRALPTYTEKVHARRLLQMLEKPDPCACCPAQPDFKQGGSADQLWNKKGSSPCYICRTFVWASGCPCATFGRSSAIKRTWLALEEKGYI